MMNTLGRTNANTSNFIKKIVISNPIISAPASYTYYNSRQSTIICSTSGQYVSYCASGGIYTSTNFGATFTTFLLPFTFSSICMSSSGQYQYVSAYGIPEGAIFSSIDYGASFTRRLNTGTNTSRFLEAIICSQDGMFVFSLGNGPSGQNNFYSTNYAITFTACHDPLLRLTGVINGTNILLYEQYGNQMRTCSLANLPPVETTVTASPYNTSTGTLSNENNFVVMLPNNHTSIQTSTTFGTGPWTNIQGTPTFKFCYIINSIIYACSTNIVYKSINQGITWTIIYSLTSGNTIKSFTGNASKIFMVYVNGSISILTL